VLGTFALGTAAGDLTAYSLHLGFWTSAVLFAVIFALPAIGWWRLNLNPVVAFWAAYVVTRPLGASFADWLGKPSSLGGGLGFGDGTVAAVGFAIFVLLVTFVQLTGHGVQQRPPALARPEVSRWS